MKNLTKRCDGSLSFPKPLDPDLPLLPHQKISLDFSAAIRKFVCPPGVKHKPSSILVSSHRPYPFFKQFRCPVEKISFSSQKINPNLKGVASLGY
jgi:hypothetical protein